jgi:hypothetical protein
LETLLLKICAQFVIIKKKREVLKEHISLLYNIITRLITDFATLGSTSRLNPIKNEATLESCRLENSSNMETIRKEVLHKEDNYKETATLEREKVSKVQHNPRSCWKCNSKISVIRQYMNKCKCGMIFRLVFLLFPFINSFNFF